MSAGRRRGPGDCRVTAGFAGSTHGGADAKRRGRMDVGSKNAGRSWRWMLVGGSLIDRMVGADR